MPGCTDLLAKGALKPREIVDLLDAQAIAIAHARPLTRGEWISIWSRGRRWKGKWKNGPKQYFSRLRRRLLELAGVTIEWETREGHLAIHVATPELVALLAPYEGRARALLNPKEAPAHELSSSLYQDRKVRIRDLKKKFRCGAEKLKKVLGAMRVTIREPRRLRVEERAGDEQARLALEEHDQGASLSYVAWLLHCSKSSARRFLERNGRVPPADPPGVAFRCNHAACERSATCA